MFIESKVKYHVQDLNFYCGPACAQMVLASSKVDVGLIDQEDLFKEIRNGTTYDKPQWTSGPDGLTKTLNKHTNTKKDLPNFIALRNSERDKLERAMVWTLHKYGVASIAMVKGRKHWVVVYGAYVDKAPLSPSDTSYTIEGFLIREPLVQLDSITSCPIGNHKVDDACGEDSCPAPASTNVKMSQWRADYMAQPAPTEDYPEGYIVITLRDTEEVVSPMPDKSLSRESPKAPGLTDGEAGVKALEGLKEQELRDAEPWKTAMGGNEKDMRPGKAVPVERLDVPNTFHYIALIETPAGGTPIAVTVHGNTGEFQESLAVTNPRASALPMISLDKVLEAIKQNGYRVVSIDPGLQGPQERGKRLPGENVVAHPDRPHLVWMPCLESFSPFYPFYMLKQGDQDLYARIDVLDSQGRVRSGDEGVPLFTSLHTDVVGV